MTVYQYPTPPPYVFDLQEARRLMFDPVDYIPLAIAPLPDPPSGRVQLLKPNSFPESHPDHRDANRWLHAELGRRRTMFRDALAAGDPFFREEQAAQFATLTTRLIWQRFRLRSFRLIGAFTRIPAAAEWFRRFDDPQVVERASVLYDRHCDVLLTFDVVGGDFDLCAPTTRGRRIRDTIVASLQPVFDALAVLGLRIEPEDHLRDVARTFFRLARGEHTRLGSEEFNRRYSRDEP